MHENEWNTLEKETKEYAKIKLDELAEIFKESISKALINSEKISWYNAIENFIDDEKIEQIYNPENQFNNHELEKYAYKKMIDNWYQRQYDKYKEYQDKYYNEYNEKIKSDYELLIKELNSEIPKIFKNDLVKVNYYDPSKLYTYINYNPFSNSELLPVRYSFVDKEKGYEIKVWKGEIYTVNQIYTMNKYQDYESIAPLFALAFISDYKESLQKYYLTIDFIEYAIQRSIDLLVRNGYDKPDTRYKRFLLPDERTLYSIEKELSSINSEKELAKYIANFIEKIYKPFDIIYYRHTDEDYRKAKMHYKNVAYEFQKKILEGIDILK